MDPISLSGLVNLGYLFVGVLALWGLIRYANHSGITGESFHLGQWLDVIAGKRAPDGPEANRLGMALVIVALLVGGAVLVSAFIRG